MNRLFIAILIFTAAVCCNAQEIVIGPGDVLDVAVWNHEDLSMVITVTPDGMIAYPLIGSMNVAGRTLDSVRKEIEDAVAQQIRDPKVAVNLSASASRASVLGEVRSPGQYSVSKPLKVSELVALAGGTTETAWLQHVTLVRATGQTERLDLSTVLSGGDLSGNVEVKAGDLLLVPKLELRVAVLGKVEKPGSYDMTRPDATIIDALSASGGVVKGAKAESSVIVRRTNGVQTVTKVDLKSAAAGTKPCDIALQDGDIIYVPESHRLDWDKGFQAIIGLTGIANLLIR